MHDSSIFNIRIDFEKSHDSYIYDKNSNRHFLDFFGLYSSLPLGYSHPIFKGEGFRKELNRVAGIKVPNCEVISDEAREFLQQFSKHKAMSGYRYFHFCCTGALAIEAALKNAIDQKGAKKPVIISLKESFHGINSYGGFVTDRFFPVSTRLDGLPQPEWCCKIYNPKIIYKGNKIDEDAAKKGMERFIKEFADYLDKYGPENIAALLIEPVQSTYGDNYFSREFFNLIRRLCDEHKVCLIFDEIQTGFGATGEIWYFQHLNIEPDIVVFGKKSQVSGIMVKENFSKTFETPVRLEVTWDGDLVDMVRSKYVLKAYEEYKIMDNVKKRNKELIDGLKDISGLQNIRAAGLLVAFDFKMQKDRDLFFNRAVEKRFICNKTRDITVRFRPNLNISSEEVQEALRIINSSV